MTYARVDSLKAARGVSAMAAMEILSHTSISTTTNICTQSEPELLNEVSEKMVSALRPKVLP